MSKHAGASLARASLELVWEALEMLALLEMLTNGDCKMLDLIDDLIDRLFHRQIISLTAQVSFFFFFCNKLHQTVTSKRRVRVGQVD